MLYRRAKLDDFSQIIELQNVNLLSARQNDLAGGFLATAYTAAQFQQMNEEMCVVVCEADGNLCGYLGSCHIDFFRQFPIAKAMIDRLNLANYRGSSLDLSRVLFANPICIKAHYRGQGVYLELCKTLFPYLPEQYDLAAAFVPVENKRSFTAASRLGFDLFDQFKVNGKTFYGMMISLPEFGKKFVD